MIIFITAMSNILNAIRRYCGSNYLVRIIYTILSFENKNFTDAETRT